jgi:hypothetical protein
VWDIFILLVDRVAGGGVVKYLFNDKDSQKNMMFKDMFLKKIMNFYLFQTFK